MIRWWWIPTFFSSSSCNHWSLIIFRHDFRIFSDFPQKFLIGAKSHQIGIIKHVIYNARLNDFLHSLFGENYTDYFVECQYLDSLDDYLGPRLQRTPQSNFLFFGFCIPARYSFFLEQSFEQFTPFELSCCMPLFSDFFPSPTPQISWPTPSCGS